MYMIHISLGQTHDIYEKFVMTFHIYMMSFSLHIDSFRFNDFAHFQLVFPCT